MKFLKATHCSSQSGFSRIALPCLVLSSCLFLSQSAFAGVISLGSTLELKARANSNGAGEVTDIDSASQGSSLSNLGVSVSATSTSTGGFATVSGSGSASWVNAAQGQVQFDNLGWESLNNTSYSLVDIGGFNSDPIWSYTFEADVDGLFTMDWSVFVESETTTEFGLGGFRFSLTGAGGGQSLFQVGAPGTTNSGTTTRNIFAGNQYTAILESDAALVGGIATRTAFMDGDFNWSMDSGPFSSVPEPGSVILLSLGLLALTRRKLTS